jgi:hypothetical protein
MSSAGVRKSGSTAGGKTYGVSRKKFADFTRHISVGTPLQGRVIDELGDEKYVVAFRGFNFFAQSEEKLHKGQRIEGSVAQVSPRVVVQLRREGEAGVRNGPGETRLIDLVA